MGVGLTKAPAIVYRRRARDVIVRIGICSDFAVQLRLKTSGEHKKGVFLLLIQQPIKVMTRSLYSCSSAYFSQLT